MTDTADDKRIFLAPGELRTDVLELFADTPTGLDLLLAAPFVLAPREQELAQLELAPHAPFSTELAALFRQRLVSAFQRQVDALPQLSRWENILHRWLRRLSDGSARAFYYYRSALYSHVLSRPDASVLLAGPLTVAKAALPPGHELELSLNGSAHRAAREWFHRRRSESEDVSAVIRAILAASWAGALLSPEELYHKVLVEYFRATLDGIDVGDDDNPMLTVMTDFQAKAYFYAKGILRRFGGVLLADVVGLGKTFIGLALLRHLQQSGQHGVVVAPPAVCETWRALASEYRIELQVVSHGKLEDLDRFIDREVLVVDESHTFRNINTRRYEMLHRWMNPDGVPSNRKVILISATPQNNRPRDILHQLRLFPVSYSRLPYRGESLEDYFRRVEGGREPLTNLLQHIVVRRTRKFIRATYPDAVLRVTGPNDTSVTEPLRFPTRVSGPDQCLRYRIDVTARGGLYDLCIASLRRMRYPLYGLLGYVHPEHGNDPRLGGITRAGRSLRGLFKVLLLKRLESSIVAFRTTFERLLERLDRARAQLLEDHQVQVRRYGTDTASCDDDLDYNDEELVPAELFDGERLLGDIENDQRLAMECLATVAEVQPSGDVKLKRLLQYLSERPPGAHRILVFTQFADTADYLYGELSNRFPRVGIATGRTGDLMRITRRFAPRANRATVPVDEQIELLVSTDVLSEGVNLQDADTLISYDLHWNPVRLIQRAGRIDRIGSPNEEIHIASFLPERKLESHLGLESVLRSRIQEFVSVFGEDSTVLPSEETLDESAVVDAYTGAALEKADDSDEMDGLSRHLEAVLHIRSADSEHYNRLRELRLGRRALSSATSPAVAAMRLGWYWAFYAPAASGASPDLLTDLAGLDLLKRHSQSDMVTELDSVTAALPMLGEFVEAARAVFQERAKELRGQQIRPSLNPTEEWIRVRLEEYRANCPPARRPHVAEMLSWLMAGQQKATISRLAAPWRREDLTPEAVYDQMRSILRRFPVIPHDLGDMELIGSVFGVSAAGSRQRG